MRYPGPVSESGTTYTGNHPTDTTTIPKADPNVHYTGGLKGGQMPAHPPLQQQHLDASRKPVGTTTSSNPGVAGKRPDAETTHPSALGSHEQSHQDATLKEKAHHAWEDVKGAAVHAKDKVVDAFSGSSSDSPQPVCIDAVVVFWSSIVPTCFSRSLRFIPARAPLLRAHIHPLLQAQPQE